MWIDENGTPNTMWAPPVAILGSAVAEFLSALGGEERERVLVDLDARYDEVFDRPVRAATDHPDVFVESLSEVPPLPGLAAHLEGDLTAGIMRYIDGLPPTWQIEAYEAVSELLAADGDPDGSDEGAIAEGVEAGDAKEC